MRTGAKSCTGAKTSSTDFEMAPSIRQPVTSSKGRELPKSPRDGYADTEECYWLLRQAAWRWRGNLTLLLGLGVDKTQGRAHAGPDDQERGISNAIIFPPLVCGERATYTIIMSKQLLDALIDELYLKAISPYVEELCSCMN